jgi:ketosteroid isomerase-like protein
MPGNKQEIRKQESPMSERLEQARAFFDAVETGKGWEVCRQWCHPDAVFAAQAGSLAEVATVEAYAEWMKDIYTPMPDARYEMTFFGEDTERGVVTGCAVFMGTHTGPGGPVEPTGKSVAADYAYMMEFDGDRIRKMTKIWNDAHSFAQVGWA